MVLLCFILFHFFQFFAKKNNINNNNKVSELILVSKNQSKE